MPDRLFRLYQRKRIININANVVAAGLLSTVMVMGLIWILKHPCNTHWPTWGYTLFSVGSDIVLDVAIFAGLHWIANHWRPSKPQTRKEELQLGAAAPPHLEDTAKVQLERAVLGPLYYLIAAVGTEALQRGGMHPSWAVLIAYPFGLLVTRVLHTVWGIRSGTFVDNHIRAKQARIKAKKQRRAERDDQAQARRRPAIAEEDARRN